MVIGIIFRCRVLSVGLSAFFGLLPLGRACATDVADSVLGVDVEKLHEFGKLLHLEDMRVCLFSSKWNPFDVILLILTLVDTHSNFVLKASVIGLIFVVQAVQIVNIVPKEMLFINMLLEFLIIFLQLN